MRRRAAGWGGLAKASESDVEGLLGAAMHLARRVAPVVVEHEAAERGFVPVFVDGTEAVATRAHG